MEGLCAAPSTGGAFLSGTLGFIDCQAQSIAASGYQALSSPGSIASVVLTALLTLFIAIIGIRLLMGQALGSGDIIGIGIKLGVVLALATSWAAYRTVAYDLVLKGPAELVGAIGGPAGLPGAEGGLVARLQGVDNGIVAFTIAGSGRYELNTTPSPDRSLQPPEARTLVAGAPITDDGAFGTARIAYLATILGTFGLVRIGAALLLAIGPLVAGLLLFESTRGLFLGWARMLTACLLGGVATALVLALELGLLEPWLGAVLAQRAAGIKTLAAPMELLAITLAFAAILVGVLAMAVRIAFMAHSPVWLQQSLSRLGDAWTTNTRADMRLRPRGASANVDQGRADRVADAVLASQQRERYRVDRAEAGGRGAGRVTDRMQPVTTPTATPLGQTYRRTAQRASVSGTIRSTRR